MTGLAGPILAVCLMFVGSVVLFALGLALVELWERAAQHVRRTRRFLDGTRDAYRPGECR